MGGALNRAVEYRTRIPSRRWFLQESVHVAFELFALGLYVAQGQGPIQRQGRLQQAGQRGEHGINGVPNSGGAGMHRSGVLTT